MSKNSEQTIKDDVTEQILNFIERLEKKNHVAIYFNIDQIEAEDYKKPK